MKKILLIISIYLFLFACNNNYAQVQTGAISIYNLCGDYGNDGGGCDLSSMYTVFSPMTLSGTTACSKNCGSPTGSCASSSPNCPGCTGSTTADHIQAYISVWIPATCVVDIVTEYGAPYNANASCSDSRMDAGGPDALCINSGSSPSIIASLPVLASEFASAKSAAAANIGTCSAGTTGIGTAMLDGGATGLGTGPAGSVCYINGGTGNGDVLCTASGFSGGGGGNWVTLWYFSNRSDEIMTYTITPTGGTCTDIGYIVLPIELLNFVAWKTSSGIQLGWTTSNEINSDYFLIEYSLDATTFMPYKKIKAAGYSNENKKYTCAFDIYTENSRPYFRLKEYDMNGSFKYSPIINLGTSFGTLTNPVDAVLKAFYSYDRDKIVADFHSDYPQEINISLYDASGNKISEINSQFAEGDNEILITGPDNTGVYFLVYVGGNKLPVHKKIVVCK